ncbi:MAG: diguanylate cyclase [bacterium]
MVHSVLIIDDSEYERIEIKNLLEKTGLFDAFYEASDGLKGFKSMLANPPDLIICDLVMPDFDGFKFLRLKKARQDYDNIPVLIVTGRDDLNDKIRGLEEGAQDYVLKPFNPLELVARVKAHLRIKLLQDELKHLNEKLETLSNTDPLTDLYNRRYFFSILEKEFERSKRYNRALSLLIIDIDFFKSVNDECGHLTGDKVLTIVARILKTNLRKIDICARYGGEEFVILLPETDINGAMSVANRSLADIREQDLSDICSKIKTITISIGIACLPDNDIKNIDAFIKYADQALYTAKKQGRNRVVVHKTEQ